MVLKLEKIFRVLHPGFGRREITWVQTGFFRCADEFPAWKGELHGTQMRAWLVTYAGLEEDKIA